LWGTDGCGAVIFRAAFYFLGWFETGQRSSHPLASMEGVNSRISQRTTKALPAGKSRSNKKKERQIQ
jgi:hypothetical protein